MVTRDLAMMGIGGWKGLMNDRGEWRRIVAEAARGCRASESKNAQILLENCDFVITYHVIILNIVNN